MKFLNLFNKDVKTFKNVTRKKRKRIVLIYTRFY